MANNFNLALSAIQTEQVVSRATGFTRTADLVQTYTNVISFLVGLNSPCNSKIGVISHEVKDIRYKAATGFPASHGVAVRLQELLYKFDGIPMLTINIPSPTASNPDAVDIVHHPAIRLPYLQLLFDKVAVGASYVMLHVTLPSKGNRQQTSGHKKSVASVKGTIFFTESASVGRLNSLKVLLERLAKLRLPTTAESVLTLATELRAFTACYPAAADGEDEDSDYESDSSENSSKSAVEVAEIAPYAPSADERAADGHCKDSHAMGSEAAGDICPRCKCARMICTVCEVQCIDCLAFVSHAVAVPATLRERKKQSIPNVSARGGTLDTAFQSPMDVDSDGGAGGVGGGTVPELVIVRTLETSLQHSSVAIVIDDHDVPVAALQSSLITIIDNAHVPVVEVPILPLAEGISDAVAAVVQQPTCGLTNPGVNACFANTSVQLLFAVWSLCRDDRAPDYRSPIAEVAAADEMLVTFFDQMSVVAATNPMSGARNNQTTLSAAGLRRFFVDLSASLLKDGAHTEAADHEEFLIAILSNTSIYQPQQV